MTRYRILGSIYGSNRWKKLIADDCVNIFTGNYFDPLNGRIDNNKVIDNFKELISYNQKHNNCVFLIGNHDFHYLNKYEKYDRFNKLMASTYHNLLSKNHINKIAYSIDNKILITHAGIGMMWLKDICRMNNDIDKTPISLTNYVNKLYVDDPDAFSYNGCSALNDITGNSVSHGPMWLNTDHLPYINPFKNTIYKQIVGHNIVKKIDETDGIWNVGCLPKNNACLEYDSDNDSFNVIKNIV